MTAPDCPTPHSCPVPDPTSVDLRRLRLAHLELDRVLHRVHATAYPVTGFNAAGAGDSRFAPLPGRGHLYAGDTSSVALLETVFHNVHQAVPRVIYTATDLRGRALGRMRVVDRRVPVADLRDQELGRLRLDRSQLITTSAAHHPCTRQWAEHLMRRRIGGVAPAGLLWHSRVAELAGVDSPLFGDLLSGSPAEACVLYDGGGAATLSDAGGGFHDLVGPTQGRLLVDRIAQELGAVIH